VRILADVERAGNSFAFAILTDGLRGRENVRLGERPIKRRAAMPARAEADKLVHVRYVRPLLIIIAFEFRDIDQQICGSGFAGQRIQSHGHRESKSRLLRKMKLSQRK
jgi:hypothetical protein